MARDTEQAFAVSANSSAATALQDRLNANQALSANTSSFQEASYAQSDVKLPAKKKFVQRIIPQQMDDVTVFWSKVTLVAIIIAGILAFSCEAWIMINDSWLKAHLLSQYKTDEFFKEIEQIVNDGFIVAETYHAIYLAGFLFWVIVTWDGIMHKNVIQVISVNVYNVGLFVYSILQMQQIKNHMEDVRNAMVVVDRLADNTGLFLVAQILLIVLLGLFIPVFAFLTYKLYGEFGWRQYRISSGNPALEKVFIAYHILLLVLKFGVFFMLAFVVFNLVLTQVTRNGAIIISTAGLVVAIILPLLGFYGARRENKILSSIFVLGCLGCLSFIAERVYRAFSRERTHPDKNRVDSDSGDWKLPFMMYAATAFIILLVGVVYGVVCMFNYGKGLKDALDGEEKRKRGEMQAVVHNLDD
ncbi:hypothetical protein HDU77_006019 [Chytriomyces hyalinus]|nr:hypothetical protein HDU77_006019 [Chytriomyces hyalinus]